MYFDQCVTREYYYTRRNTICMAIVALFAICFASEASQNKERLAVNENNNFERCWNRTLPVLSDVFGSTDIAIASSNRMKSINDFESFVNKCAQRNGLKLIKRTVHFIELEHLPKPLMLINKNETGFTLLLDIFKSQINTNIEYQILHAENKPVVITQENLQKDWEGEIWLLEKKDHGSVRHASGDIILELNKIAYNFGLVEPSRQKSILTIKNLSNIPVKLKKAKTSCSCTITKLPDNIILQPLQEIESSVSVSINENKKAFRYAIIIPFEDIEGNNTDALKIDVMGNCNVHEEHINDNATYSSLKTIPEKILFHDIKVGKIYKQKFTIILPYGQELQNLEIISNSKFLSSAFLERVPYQKTNEYLVELTLNSSTLRKGNKYDDLIAIKTTNEDYSNFEIPVHIETLPELRAYPSSINLGNIKIGEEISRTIYLKSLHDKDLKVLKCITPSGINTTFDKVRKDIVLTINALFDEPMKYQEEIKIVLSNPAKQDILIPIHANIIK